MTTPHRVTAPMHYKHFLIAKGIARNYLTRIRFQAGDYASNIGSTHSRFSVERSIAYIDGVFGDYLLFGGLEATALKGKRVLEIGHGDSLGVALHFAASGSRVVCMDKFRARSDAAHQRNVYQAMARRWTRNAAVFVEQGLAGENIRFDPAIIAEEYGHGIEDPPPAYGPASFDLIVSRAVLEEVPLLDRAFVSMHRLLAPGGMLLHKVDLSDYGLLSSKGFHELEFMTIPDVLYRNMSSASGLPNRHRLDFYRSQLSGLGFETAFYITRLLGSRVEFEQPTETPPAAAIATAISALKPIQNRLCSSFRSLSQNDLVTMGIFIAARKPR